MMLRAFVILLWVGLALFLTYLGFQWIYIGYGMNPWVAFPFASACYLLPYAMLLKEAEDLDIEVEDLLEHVDKLENKDG